MTPEEKAIQIEAMHHACRLVRLAIAVIEADVPIEESTAIRVDEAITILQKVAEDIRQ